MLYLIGQNAEIFLLYISVPGYLGCYGNSKTDWVLNGGHYRSKALTIRACLEFCKREHFKIAGLERGDCYCGNDQDVYDRLGQFDDTECNIVCDGSKDDACGGFNKLSVYNGKKKKKMALPITCGIFK